MKRSTLEIYKAKDGYRWRLVAANGRIICESGEAFTRKPKPADLADKMIDAFQWCKIEVKP
jgi:hypothetical protein